MRAFASIRLVALLALVAACKAPTERTELILGVATDLSAPTPLANINMEVIRLPQNLTVGLQDFPISGDLNQLYELPGTYAVYSPDGSPDRVRVILRGQDKKGAVLVERRALLTLVPHRTLFVRLGVVSACQGKNDCPAGDTCVDGRCRPEAIDTSRLPDYVAGMEKALACAGATTYVDTSTRKPLPLLPSADGGPACGQGSCSEGVCFAAVPGAFQPTNGPMTEVRSASNQIGGRPLVLDDGRVLFVGGLGPQAKTVLSTAELYDPATGTFTTTGSLAEARVYFGAAKLLDGRVLVAGGINDGAAALASAEVFDPKTGTFTPTKMPMTVARTFPAAATLADGRVLVAGGMNDIRGYAAGGVSYAGGLDGAELYDPATDTFTATAGRLAESRAFAQTVPVAGGALVLCGEYQFGARATIERFDEATGLFSTTALPAGVAGCIAGLNVLLPDRQLLITAEPNHAWLYDTVAKTFAAADDHPTAVPGGVAALLPGGDVLFAGSYSKGAAASARAYLFREATRSFSFVDGDLSVPRAEGTGVTLPTGDVLIAGGSGDATAELFHLAP
jgi:hypothetical protein